MDADACDGLVYCEMLQEHEDRANRSIGFWLAFVNDAKRVYVSIYFEVFDMIRNVLLLHLYMKRTE